MTEHLDELYFRWLCAVAGTNRRKTYWNLFSQLHHKEFVWLVPNDDNRLEDGRDLREEFAEEKQLDDIDPMWMTLGCSMLEMFIALSRRLAFEGGNRSRVWFWVMMTNLHLIEYPDGVVESGEIDDILNTVIWRTYLPNGHGGIFPLDHSEEDQRDVEIWYQLSAYLLER